MTRADEVVIRLTPSGRLRVLLSRTRWGWRPGLPVLITRLNGGFGFGIAEPGVEPTVDFYSGGVLLAVRPNEMDHFRGSVLSSHYDALFDSNEWWLENPNDRGRSGCSDPLGASCCPAKFRRLHPELFGLRGWLSRILGTLSAEDRDQLIARTSAYLRWGDARAAVVLGTAPLIVATYCDEMDAAFLLRFPDSLVGEYSLSVGTRLVTTNLHTSGQGGIAPDIVPGPAYLGRYTNVRPLVADFLAAEEHLVTARRRAISEREYRRCQELGERSLREGQPIRSGRPLEAATPGMKANR
jgi:hypothetical protein